MAQATASANDLERGRFRFRAPDPAGSPRPCSGQDGVGTSDAVSAVVMVCRRISRAVASPAETAGPVSARLATRWGVSRPPAGGSVKDR
ncbi:hypothetical protein ABZ851_25770 [Streptomyces sp. NPDC047049]|uniref:hypothetical protein n=1 Tax=Streptomyces sp. NPDC047049 TaxID=3156688 RepID=UPI003405B9E1